jgi:hypothetical protein
VATFKESYLPAIEEANAKLDEEGIKRYIKLVIRERFSNITDMR